MKKILIACLFCLVLPLTAGALTFTGSSVGSWSDVISTDPFDVYSFSNNDLGGTSNFNWGIPVDTPFDNQLTFDGTGSDGGSGWSFNTETDSVFQLGDFSYRNGSTFNSIGVEGVTLNIDLAITAPLNTSQLYSFDFLITNTPNVTGDPVLDGDIVTSISDLSDTFFFYDGSRYTLDLLGFSSDGGLTLRSDFSSPEGAIAYAGVYGRIAQPVPEPSTFALLGFGLAGLFYLSRRKKVLA